MPKLARKKKSNLPVKKASKTKQRFKAPLLGVNEKLAFKFFKTLGVWWQEKRGFYADLIPPQRRWFPEELRSDPQKLGWWFFCVAIPIRGGINSDDAFRFVYELYRDRPDLFNPYVAMYMEPEEIAGATEKVAMRIHPGGSQGEKQKGTFSYQSYQHERIWIHNAKVLVEHWGADLRNVFEGALDFEKAFAKIDHKRSKKGFRGMRRKIFSLMTTWLIEFGLVPDFQLPLIIDFHAMRLLLMHEIIQVEFSELGPGKPRDPLRIRPESMWKHAAVHISEPFVDQVIFWTLAFLKKYKRLLPCQYDIAHGKWFLSRVLCPDYYGNRSFEQKHEDGKRRGLTERLVSDEELLEIETWPVSYRDPCRLCPVEESCKARFPQGPYFDWGAMVRAGDHITYPLRKVEPHFRIITRDMPGTFLKSSGDRVSNSVPKNSVENKTPQLPLGF